jgi:hypothetical protein
MSIAVEATKAAAVKAAKAAAAEAVKTAAEATKAAAAEATKAAAASAAKTAVEATKAVAAAAEAAKTAVDATKAVAAEVTDAAVEATKAAEATEAAADPTEAAADSTEAAADPTEAAADPTEAAEASVPQSGGGKIVESLLFLACLAAALQLTDWSMQSNVQALPLFSKGGKGAAEKHVKQPGAKYVRLDSRFMADFAWPLVLQGATTTCYCVAMFAAASALVSLAAYASVAMKAPVLMKGKPSSETAHAAVRAVLENSLASGEMMILVALAMAFATGIAAAVAAAAVAAGGAGEWSFVDGKHRYIDVDVLSKMSAVSTWAALPSAVGFMFWGTRLRQRMQRALHAFFAWLAERTATFFKAVARELVV